MVTEVKVDGTYANGAFREYMGEKIGDLTVIAYTGYRKIEKKGGKAKRIHFFTCTCKCGNIVYLTLHEVTEKKVKSCGNCIRGAVQTEQAKLTEPAETTEPAESTEITESAESTERAENKILDKYVIPVYDIFNAYKDYTYEHLVGRRVANITIEAFQRDVNSSTSYMIVKCDCGAKFVISNKAMTYVKKQSDLHRGIKFFISHNGCTINFPKKRSAYLKYLNESHNAPMIDTFAEIEDLKELLSMNTNNCSEDDKKEANSFEESKEEINSTYKNNKTEETGDVSIMKVDNYIVRNDGKLDVDATFNRCIGAVIAMSTAKMDNYSVAEYTVNNFEVKIKNNAAGRFAKQFMDIVKGYENMFVLRDEMLELLIKHYLQKE